MNKAITLDRGKFEFVGVILLALLVLMGTISNIFSYIAFIGALALLLAYKDITYPMSVLLFLSSWAGIFKASPESTSMLTYLMIAVAIVFMLRKQKHKWVILIIGVFAILTIFGQFLYDNVNITRYIKMIVNLLLIYLVSDISDEGSKEKMSIYYVSGVLLSSAVAYISPSIFNISEYVTSKDLGILYESVGRFSGLYPDPNYYTVNIIISMCLLVILLNKKKVNTPVFIIGFAVMIFFALSTLSKSAILTLIFPVFLLIYSIGKRKYYFLGLITLVAGGILMYMGASGRIPLVELILSRFETTDITTGRVEIWEMYIEYFREDMPNLIFGNGLGAPLLNNYGAHNTFLDIIYYTGLIGLVIYIVCIIDMFRRKGSKVKKNILNFAVIIAMVALYSFLSEFLYVDFPFHIILALIVYNMSLRSNNIEVIEERTA